MTPTPTTERARPTASGIAAAATGIGILTFALFPIAIPFLLLAAAFTAPLVILPIAAALPVAILAGVALAVQGMGRWLGNRYASTARAARARRRTTPGATESGA